MGTRLNEQPLRLGTVQKVAVVTASAATASALSGDTQVVRIATSTDCYIAFAATATTSDTFMPAGTVEYFLSPGAIKVAAIRNSADGVLTVTECSK